MADNLTLQTTLATPPSGAIIATEIQTDNSHRQKILLADGTKDSANLAAVDATGHVAVATGAEAASLGAGTAPSKAVVGAGQYNTSAPAPTNGQTAALQLDGAGNLKAALGAYSFAGAVWNSSTSVNAVQTIASNAGPAIVSVFLVQSGGTFSTGAITFEGTYDGTNWVTVPANLVVDPGTLVPIAIPYTLVTSTNKAFAVLLGAFQQIRMKLSTAITGSGTVTPEINWMYDNPMPILGAHGGLVVERPASTPVNQTSVGASASSVSLLAANASRKGVAICNDSTATLYLRLDASAATNANFSFLLSPGATWEDPFNYTGEIRGIWTSATGNARVSEWT